MKLLKHLLILLGIKLPLQLIGIPVLAIALLFVSRDKEVLPKYLRWFDNHEKHLRDDGDDGLSGPSYIRDKWEDPTGWLARFNWLALRNPVNYFQYAVLGGKKQSEDKRIKLKGDFKVGTHDWNTRGWYYQEYENGLWELYAVIPLYKNWHFRARIGHKLGGHYSGRKDGDWVQWVFAVTPLKKLD